MRQPTAPFVTSAPSAMAVTPNTCVAIEDRRRRDAKKTSQQKVEPRLIINRRPLPGTDGGKSQYTKVAMSQPSLTAVPPPPASYQPHYPADGNHTIPEQAPKTRVQADGGKPQFGNCLTKERNGQSMLGTSPINKDLFKKLLNGFEHEEFISDGLANGFIFHFDGLQCPITSKNSKMANLHSEAVDNKIQEEIGLGRIAGPYHTPPFTNFKASPLSLREKSTPGSFRLLHNLSYPYDTSSVNGGIDQAHKTVKYATVQTAIKVINKLGKGCFMAKADIKSAYRLIPINPSHFHLLGFRWRGSYYYDKFLPMGMAESCSIFEKISDGIAYVMKNYGIANIVKVLDDFLILEHTEIECNSALGKFKFLMAELGFPLVSDKTSTAATQDLTFLGVRLNSNTMTAQLPLDKLAKYSKEVQGMLNRDSVSLKDLQKIIGQLQFSTCVIPIGKPFLRRLIDLTRGHQISATISLSESAKADLRIWAEFLAHYNGISVMTESPKCDSNTIHLLSDASDLGFGGSYAKQWIQGRWDPFWKSLNIAVRELYPILVLVKLFGHLWENHHIIFHCDNQAIVSCLNKHTAKDKNIMSLLRPLILQLMIYNIKFQSVYVKSCDNVLADAISRFQETPQLLEDYGMRPSATPVPDSLHPRNFISPS